MLKIIILIIALASTVGCVRKPPVGLSQAVHQHASEAKLNLQPYFEKARVGYPPKDIALLVFKNTSSLQLWARDNRKIWHYVRTYPVLAKSGTPGPKLRNGDRQIPEGVYHVVGFNPASRFDLSLLLDYPNRMDRYYAAVDGRRDLGDSIFIHGSHYSVGCIAVGDSAIHDLFVLSYWVGVKHITVIIAPEDLRRHHIRPQKLQPSWLPQLYDTIQRNLSVYL